MSDEILPPADQNPHWAETWRELGQGVPTLSGLARICSVALASGGNAALPLSVEARAILFAARQRCVIEVKGANRAFDAPGRMLAVYVEISAEETVIFRSRSFPAFTIRCLDGFRQLCMAGLVMHHIYQEFSLTVAGIERAATISAAEVQSVLDMATTVGLYE